MTDPGAYAADPNHVPHPGRPPAERDSQGASDMPDAQRPAKDQQPDEGDTAHEQTTTMRTREPESTHGPAHEERPVDGPSTAPEPSSADSPADDERTAPDEAVADTRPSARDVTALNEPTAAVGDRRPDPPAEDVDPDPRHRGDVGDERGPGVR